MLLQNELPIITEEPEVQKKITMVETGTQCFLEMLSEHAVEQPDEPGLKDPTETMNNEEVEQLQQNIAGYKKDIAEKVNTIAKKNREIEGLKERVGNYKNRLENTLSENSAREREVHHLTDALDTLRRTNVELVLELNQKSNEDGERIEKSTEMRSSTEEDHAEVEAAEKSGHERPHLSGHNTSNSCKDAEEEQNKKGRKNTEEMEEGDKEDISQDERNSSLMDESKKDEEKRQRNAQSNSDKGNRNRNRNKPEKDVRKEIECNFGKNCKFWKANECRYHHSEKYKDEAVNDRKVTGNGEKVNNKHESSKPCWNGKSCTDDDCIFEHNCVKSNCESKRCRYIHPENTQTEKNLQSRQKKEYVENGSQDRKGRQQRPDSQEEENKGKKEEDSKKKDILCRFYRNCKEGDKCAYYYPESKKEAKNGGKEMQEVLHFLQKEMESLKTMNINLTREVKEIRKETSRVRQGGGSQGRTH